MKNRHFAEKPCGTPATQAAWLEQVIVVNNSRNINPACAYSLSMTSRCNIDRRRSDSPFVRVFMTLLLVGLLAGCAVGPDFKRPATPDTAHYTATTFPMQTASAPIYLGEAQRFSESMSVSAQWWRGFGSPKLDALIEQAMVANPTLLSAQATLRQAQEVYAARVGLARYPQIDASLSGQRQRFNPGSLGLPEDAREFSLFNAGIGVHYQLDLAGANRHALMALAARIDYQRYQLHGAQLALVANLITTAVTQAKLAAQVEAMETILQVEMERLKLEQKRKALGAASLDEVLALRTQVEQTRAALLPLRLQLEQSRHLLAVLAGRVPGAEEMPQFTLADFTLPSELPRVVPSGLVRQRPDIQAAEALLQAANAEYGVAIAKFYPQLNLSANLGSQALTTAALFGPGTLIWNFLGQLTQPLFNPGLSAEKRAALAAFDAAAANYQNVVLESLRNVADILRALQYDAQQLVALAAADTTAQESMESMRRQYMLGAASYVQLLVATQQMQQNKINLIAAQAQRLLDSVALYQAIGVESDGDGINFIH